MLWGLGGGNDGHSESVAEEVLCEPDEGLKSGPKSSRTH